NLNEDGSSFGGPRSLKCASFIKFAFSFRLGSWPLRTVRCPAPCIPAGGRSECAISPANFTSPSIFPVILPPPLGKAARNWATLIPLNRALLLKLVFFADRLKERSPTALPP